VGLSFYRGRMKKFAASYTDLFENVLITVIVEADDWEYALLQHPEEESYRDIDDYVDSMPNDMEEARGVFFDMGSVFDVIEIIPTGK